MPITQLHKFLTAPTTKKSKPQVVFWFSLSLMFAVVYGILALKQAFKSEYVIQDDARQHVFWMQRFLDSSLFPNDLIADYFQSVAPPGYTALYQLMASVGINPLLLSKLLPLVLGLITTGYCFGVCMQMLPVPAAGFVATLLLNHTLWLKEDLSSATARAFLYPLFIAFLYYLLRRKLLLTLVAIALQGIFYPPTVLITAGILILQLSDWERLPPRLSRHRSDYLICATGLGVALLVLLPYVLESSEFGPAVTAAQARTMPEFLPGGRTQFFADGIWNYWICGRRSGMLPDEWCQPEWRSSLISMVQSPPIWVGLALPFLLRFPQHFPLVKQITSKVTVLLQIALVSLGLFFAAYAVLFKLYLPSRYIQHSLRILLSIAAGIALLVILDAVFRWAEQAKPHRLGRQLLALGLTTLIGAALILYPGFLRLITEKGFPRPGYVVGEAPQLYEFFAQQPKDTLIASLAIEADNLPTFSQRSVLVSREYGIPYHVGYYRQFSQRATDLIRAQYSQNLADVQNLIKKYRVDFWLLDHIAFTPDYLLTHRWLAGSQFQPQVTEIRERLKQGAVPALAKNVVEECSVFKTENLTVLQAECITKVAQK